MTLNYSVVVKRPTRGLPLPQVVILRRWNPQEIGFDSRFCGALPRSKIDGGRSINRVVAVGRVAGHTPDESAMSKSRSKTRPPEDILACVRLIAERVWGPRTSDADGIMSAVHQAYLLVSGESHGHCVEELEAAAAYFPEAAAVVAKERNQPEVRIAGSLGKGLALLKAGKFKAAVDAFALVRSQDPAARVLTTAGLCWQVYSLALAREHRTAASRLREASRSLKDLKAPGRCLPGLLGLAEALLHYKNGQFERSLGTLAKSSEAFFSPHVPTLLDHPAFEAEVLLLRAKNLRETAKYTEALELVEQSNDLREENDDHLGETWGLVEQARLHRFLGAHQRALAELDRARRRLRQTDFSEWQARVADQRGDVFRAMKPPRLRDAEICYKDAAALGSGCKNRYLQAHLVNSRARLLEDRGENEDAAALIDKQDAVWRGKKEFGRHLYLKGSIHWRLGNLAIAEKLLRDACDQFHRYQMRSHEVLALDRLASLCLADQRRSEAERKKSACTCWAKALRVARATDVEHLVSRLQEHARILSATDLIDVIAATLDEKHTVEAKLLMEQQDAQMAAHRHRVERSRLRHWFAEIIALHLLPNPQNFPPAMLDYLRDFCVALRGDPWLLQAGRHAPISPIDDVNLSELIRYQPVVKVSPLHCRASISLARAGGWIAVMQPADTAQASYQRPGV